MSISQNFPNLAPTLTHDFVKTKRMDPRITFTRSSSATYFNSLGVLTTAANNEPRFDHDPTTLSSRGFLPEEQRTNSIRNNTMQGAVAGTPGTLPTNWNISGLGTLTQTVVGMGTSNGINYIDIRFNGTTSTTQVSLRFEVNNIIAAANGQTWAQSIWSAMVGGSTSNITQVGIATLLWDSGSVFLASIPFTSGFIANTTSTLTRITPSATIATVGTAFAQPQIYLTFNSGVAIDITLRIGLPQLEQGAFASSVIPTTTTALTRNADVASMTGTNFSSWYNATAGTLVAEAQFTAPSVAVQQYMAQLASASTDYYALFKDTTPINLTARVRSGGVDSAYMYTTGAISANTTYKNALAYAVNDFAACANGGTVQTDTSGALPVSITALGLGQATYTNAVQLNGYLRRITYYPVRLTNAQLQALTL